MKALYVKSRILDKKKHCHTDAGTAAHGLGTPLSGMEEEGHEKTRCFQRVSVLLWTVLDYEMAGAGVK